jgi:hypothetical protein
MAMPPRHAARAAALQRRFTSRAGYVAHFFIISLSRRVDTHAILLLLRCLSRLLIDFFA